MKFEGYLAGIDLYIELYIKICFLYIKNYDSRHGLPIRVNNAARLIHVDTSIDYDQKKCVCVLRCVAEYIFFVY